MSLCLTNQALRHEDEWESGTMDPHIVHFDTSCRWVVSFTPRPPGKTPYPLDRSLGGRQRRSGCCGEVKILDPTWTRTPTPRSSSSQSVAISTVLSRLLKVPEGTRKTHEEYQSGYSMPHRNKNAGPSGYKSQGLLCKVSLGVKLLAADVVLTTWVGTQEDGVRYNVHETNLSPCLCGIHPRGEARQLKDRHVLTAFSLSRDELSFPFWAIKPLARAERG
jgi:hypothetical protein